MTLINLPELSVVVPVYSRGQYLFELHKRLSNIMHLNSVQFELIFVDDCAIDSSWAVINEIAAIYPNVKGIRLSRNYGQHNATLCGIRHASYENIATIDDDLQHPPEEILTLARHLTFDCDLVWGVPGTQNHQPSRNIAVSLTKYLLKSSLGVAQASEMSSFRLFRRSLLRSFDHYKGSWAQVDLLLTWSTSSIKSIHVNHSKRLEDRSSYNFTKLMYHTWNLITGFSTLPLRISTWLGFCVSLLSFTILLYLIVLKLLLGTSVPGFFFLASLIAFLSGFQFLFLGIIGEYISRIHLGVVGKCSYSIRDVVNFSEH